MEYTMRSLLQTMYIIITAPEPAPTYVGPGAGAAWSRLHYCSGRGRKGKAPQGSGPGPSGAGPGNREAGALPSTSLEVLLALLGSLTSHITSTKSHF